MRSSALLLLIALLAACSDAEAPTGPVAGADTVAAEAPRIEPPEGRPGRTVLTGTWAVRANAGRSFHVDEQLTFDRSGRLTARPAPYRGLGPRGNQVELAYSVEDDTLIVADAFGHERFAIAEEDEGVTLTLAGTRETARLEPAAD